MPARSLRDRTAHNTKLISLCNQWVVFGHVFRNLLLPTMTVVAAGTGWLMGGLIITESVLGYPGLGRLILFAVSWRGRGLRAAQPADPLALTDLGGGASAPSAPRPFLPRGSGGSGRW